MKTKCTFIKPLGAIAALAALAVTAQAQQFTGHYPAGAEGIKAASLPPPGLYLRDYNIFYTANINKNSGLSDFDVNTYVQAPRVIWLTDYKVPLLDMNYGMDLLIPFYYAEVKVKPPGAPSAIRDSTFAMGDLQFEPLLLARHWKQFDLGAGYAFWAPTGDSQKPPFTADSRFSRLFGRGYWGHMITLGGTWYPTEDKSWSISLLDRYEINMENPDYDITPGHANTLEWGIGKSITPTIDIGLAGYYEQQVTSDSGHGASDQFDHVVALGPEISTFCPKTGLFVSLRYLREFLAQDGPEGNKVTLTVTKRW